MFKQFSIKEAKALIGLAIPVYLGQIAQIAMSFVDTVVAGQSSAVDMAAVVATKNTGLMDSLEEAKELQEKNGGFVKTMWCGELDCELKMKEAAGMSSRCMPFNQENLGDTCPICGKPAKKMIYWGVAY